MKEEDKSAEELLKTPTGPIDTVESEEIQSEEGE